MAQKEKSWINPKNIFFVGFFVFGIVSMIVQLIVDPDRFTSPGLPSEMTTYTDPQKRFSIDHPESWVVTELKNGNHGDMEMIATIVPKTSTRYFISIARKEFTYEYAEAVFYWGQQRTRPDQYAGFVPELPVTYPVDNGYGQQYEYLRIPRKLFPIWRTPTTKCIGYFLSKGTTGFDVTFCAEMNLWTKVDSLYKQMIDSFSF